MAASLKSIPFFSNFASLPFRYRVFYLLTLLTILLSAISFQLSNRPGMEWLASIALFSFSIAFLMLTGGLTYVLCFVRPPISHLPALARIPLRLLWVLFTYVVGTVLLGMFLYVSLTALSTSVPDPSRFVFVSLMLGLILLFLARLFTLLSWRRAQDLVFSIAIYNLVIGTLFWEATNVDLVQLLAGFAVYFHASQWAYLSAIMMAVLFEMLTYWLQKKYGDKETKAA